MSSPWMTFFMVSLKRFRNNKQKKVRLIASVGMPSLVLASLAFAVVTRWQEMGRDVKILRFLRWLQLSQRQTLTFLPVANSQPNKCAPETHGRNGCGRDRVIKDRFGETRARYPCGLGGSPGFAASPGFGGGAPAGAPPGRSASAGTAIKSGSVNESG
jgi:hypothetical protein